METPNPSSSQPALSHIKSIAVFCGSAEGNHSKWKNAATALGKAMAQKSLHVIYGAGSTGLMGALADATVAAGGSITGVTTPEVVALEKAYEGLTTLNVVPSMGVRKQQMVELADAFIMLPGGVGTLDEWFEVLTLRALKITDKPCGVINVDGYFDGVHRFTQSMCTEGFVKQKQLDAIWWANDSQSLLDQWGL